MKAQDYSGNDLFKRKVSVINYYAANCNTKGVNLPYLKEDGTEIKLDSINQIFFVLVLQSIWREFINIIIKFKIWNDNFYLIFYFIIFFII